MALSSPEWWMGSLVFCFRRNRVLSNTLTEGFTGIRTDKEMRWYRAHEHMKHTALPTSYSGTFMLSLFHQSRSSRFHSSNNCGLSALIKLRLLAYNLAVKASAMTRFNGKLSSQPCGMDFMNHLNLHTTGPLVYRQRRRPGYWQRWWFNVEAEHQTKSERKMEFRKR